ncbi:MAG: cell envelope integrity EipB family protein [Hyphomicrobiales bacterium]|nr:cell envelope integrity EipB family protein [Hyphomicrobiales bacterium]
MNYARLASGFLFAAMVGAAHAQPVTLAPHRAVYDLKLLSTASDKAPSAATGRIAFDFSGNACEGYVQSLRQTTEIQPDEGPTRLSDMKSTTFEDGDAKNFRFRLETRSDTGRAENVDGKAAKSGDDSFSVSLSKPRLLKVDLARTVLFPTEHMKHIIEAARAGKTIVQAKVYDGSETGEKVYDTTTIIGRPIAAAPTEEAAKIPQLQGLRRWPVAVSYFEEGGKDASPSYVLSFDLYENGVSRALKLDYGSFVLSGEMTKLEMLPVKNCAK